MKTSSKLSSVKRVYVSIREPAKAEPAKLALQPKPPSQPARFIRKRQDRCHTPDQGNIAQEKTSVSKFIYHRSLSPYMPPKENSFGYLCVPKDSDALLPTPPAKKEEGLCLPYELAQGAMSGTQDSEVLEVLKPKHTERLADLNELDEFGEFAKFGKFGEFGQLWEMESRGASLARETHAAVKIVKEEQKPSLSPACKTEKNFFKRPQVQPVPEKDLARNQTGSNFTHLRTSSRASEASEAAKKPCKLSEKNLNIEGKRSKRASIKNLCNNFSLNKKVLTKAQLLLPSESKDRKESISSTLINDENTTVASRTPSPNTSQRNSRCQALSKNFKLKKERLANEVEKHSQVKTVEKEAQEPWVSILKDLENGIALKDLPSFQQCHNSRISSKLRRDCK